MVSHSPLNRGLRTIESYIALEPPTTVLIEDAEAGAAIPYEDRWAEEIYTWFSSGRTLLAFCQLPNHPARSLVLRWVQDQDPMYDLLRERFKAGIINRAWAMIDEAGEIANEPVPMTAKGGADIGIIADKRQRMESRLQLAALFDPTKFAPMSKQAIQSQTVNQLNITQTNVTNLTDAQLQEFISEAERRRLRDRSTPGAGVGSIIPITRTAQP
jgi:hypothetical protein